MENSSHFGSLTERMKSFREEVLDEKPYIDAERAMLVTEAYRENQNQPRVMVRALMLKKILENMSIYIEDKSLLAGNQATKNTNAPIFPEYTMKFVIDELDLFEKRDGDVFYITEETKRQLREIAPFWENNNLRARGEALLPDEVSVFMETGVFGMEGKLNAGDAHLSVNYEKMLAEGLKGYEERTKQLKAALDFTQPENIDKNVFYKAVLTVIEAVHDFALRYSRLAHEMAIKEKDARIKEIEALQQHIFDYSKTRKIYLEYKRLPKAKKAEFYELHRAEIELQEASRAAFDQLPEGTKLPTVKELNAERTRLIQKRQAEYTEYRKVKAKRTEFIHAKQNADVILYRQQEHYDRTREK